MVGETETLLEKLRKAQFALHQNGLCDGPPCPFCLECPGHERGGKAPPCCDRAGEYNGYNSDGPILFRCPKGCSCHD